MPFVGSAVNPPRLPGETGALQRPGTRRLVAHSSGLIGLRWLPSEQMTGLELAAFFFLKKEKGQGFEKLKLQRAYGGEEKTDPIWNQM